MDTAEITVITLQTKGGHCPRFSRLPTELKTFFDPTTNTALIRAIPGLNHAAAYILRENARKEIEETLQKQQGKVHVTKVSSPQAFVAFAEIAELLKQFPGDHFFGDELPAIEKQIELIG